MTKYNGMDNTEIVGKILHSDSDMGFKSEVKGVFESYQAQGINLIQDLPSVIANPSSKQAFIGTATESMSDSVLMTNSVASKDPFYGSYVNCVEQLLDNTLDSIATESIMTGYAPIVAYNPFFLKKQWIDCVFKDVLMTEIPKTPVINIGFERRYAKDSEGNEYPLPEALYDDEITKKLLDEATGLNIKEEPIDINLLKGLSLIDPTYIPGVVAGDHTVELTPGLTVVSATVKDTAGTDHKVAMNMTVDITTHNFVNGKVNYKVIDTSTGEVTETISTPSGSLISPVQSIVRR